jgi:hypothetical protein
MPPQIPSNLVASESIARTLITLAVVVFVWVGAVRMQGRPANRYLTAGTTSLTLIGWAILAQRLGAANIYRAVSDSGPPDLLAALRLPLALLLPIIIVAGGIWASRHVMRLVSAIPVSWLVAAQVYRVEGGIFLLLRINGRLPWQFALPAGIGDLVTGAAAVIVASRLARGGDDARRITYLWCLFGITDLVVAVAMGVLTSPGPLHLLAINDPNLLVSAYPLVLVPTFGVPLGFILHGIVLWRIRTQDQAILPAASSFVTQPS